LRHALPDTRPTLLLGLRKPPRPPPPPSPLAQRAPGRPTPPPLPLPKRSLTLPQATSLAAAPPPPIASQSPEQRRRFARAPYVTPVRICRDDGSFVDGRCEDISVGGLLLLVPKMFEQQERVKVRFALPGGGKLLELPGIARWVKKARGTGAVGFEFSELPPESRDVIERYVTALGGE
jgi:PilZ domain